MTSLKVQKVKVTRSQVDGGENTRGTGAHVPPNPKKMVVESLRPVQ